ncbi:MAG: magnesium transporter [Mycobacterium sp.]
MLLLSQMIHRDVLDSDGRVVGRIADLTADLGRQDTAILVDGLLVQRRGAPDLLVPWAAVASFWHRDSTGLHRAFVLAYKADDLPEFEVRSIADGLKAAEILVKRDVLDTQVIDVVGQRLARVADVVLARVPGARVPGARVPGARAPETGVPGKGLELVGVDVGVGGVLRRLGLGTLAARAGENLIAFGDVHLASERGHVVQLGAPRSAVHRLDARGLAALVAKLDTDSATEVLAARGAGAAADAIRAAPPLVGERVLRAMSDAQAAEIIAAMPAENATRWRASLRAAPAFLGRAFLRFTVWPRRRHLLLGGRR